MILHLLGAFALSCCLGASVCSLDHTENKYNDIQILADKKLASYNDDSYSITLNADELNNYSFDNLTQYFLDNGNDFRIQGIFITYGDANYTYDDYDGSGNIYFVNSGTGNEISLVDTLFLFHSGGVESDFLSSLILEFADVSAIYEPIKSAIELDIQANSEASPSQILGDFVSILVGGISQLASGLAGGIVSMASALFLVTDGNGAVTGLSIFGGLIAIFAGLALAVGITTKVYTWVTSLGN